MPRIDKATGRVVAVVVLVIVVAAALRGYLPGVQAPAQQEPPRSSASLAYVVLLLSISLAIIGVALIARLRDPRSRAATAALPENRFSGGVGRPGWRVLVIAAAVLVGWLLLVWLLTRLIGEHVAVRPPGQPQPTGTPPTGGDATPQNPPDNGASGDVLGYLIASTVTLVLLVVVGIVAALRARRKTTPRVARAASPVAPPPTETAESLVRAAEVGLAEIGDLSREPREAIIACYAAMERELAHVPGAAPQDFDTPTEVLARAVEHRVLHADNALRLVDLFEEARFSSHVMNENHRETAVGVLQLVLAEVRSVV
ncbi:DUF4129 domain-containing protein [Mycobacterium shimoidei]|uniref:Protein-glutamine gamma-glutamyltransferase-like C-terminal domain-containing protein n=1 Tax=Mycobacterium shimoidei TaxID=29313 RepID=A0A1E3TFS4_MYCSH|nr:DUF4129 domain-containing protein [Mycobacterium shimoidei]MCV7260264.1 DUF4129 domain-containing protein [Mycobacterium shimoidei]ODR12848.1 hypothetical protein BHQ16_13240 [Mycobacterium shimoidei]ORW80734.1 hypothetical protein AWC26_10530 [Mycobacterium shimoidei]SRX96291.1 hypothetical protein MSP7336_04568 [Mycobacterium shimoidei]